MSTFTVTNTNNSGAGSLRQAVLDANALTGKDIINFSGLFTDGLAHTISLNGSGLSITGIELSSGREESGDGGGIYNSNSSYATATVDYSTIACNFDTPQEDSTKVIKSDDLVGKFISKHHDNWICNLSGSTFSYS